MVDGREMPTDLLLDPIRHPYQGLQGPVHQLLLQVATHRRAVLLQSGRPLPEH